jgi:hypothetical protein
MILPKRVFSAFVASEKKGRGSLFFFAPCFAYLLTAVILGVPLAD